MDDDLINLIKQLDKRLTGIEDAIKNLENRIFHPPKETENQTYSSIENDPAFTRALEIFLAADEASASLLQTEMNIGYNKASRIFSIAKQRGFILEGIQNEKGRRGINRYAIMAYLNSN